jgi:hypothetical protein
MEGSLVVGQDKKTLACKSSGSPNQQAQVGPCATLCSILYHAARAFNWHSATPPT